MSGRIVSLAGNGDFAAVRDDFDFIRVYRKTRITGENHATWEPVGQMVQALGRPDFSANGTMIAYLDRTSQRPEILRQVVEESDVLQLLKAPMVVSNEISMDNTATVMTVRSLLDRQLDQASPGLVDLLITYRFNGVDWAEYSNRLVLDGIEYFRLSPTASDMVIAIAKGDSGTIIRLYHMSNESITILEPLAPDIEFAEKIFSLKLAEKSFVVTSADHAQVYSYSGRLWGQTMQPNGKKSVVIICRLESEWFFHGVGVHRLHYQ